MNRDEFLQELRKYLTGLNKNETDAIIDFYINYFNEQSVSGRSEEDIIEELGSPRLLAKSIKDNKKLNKSSNNYSYNTKGGNEKMKEGYNYNGSDWKNKILAAVILILLVSLVATVVAGVVTLFVKIVIPVLVVLAIIGIVKNIFTR